MGTEFANNSGALAAAAATKVWVERNLFPAVNMMPVRVAAEGLVAVLATEAHVDDIAIVPRTRDADASTTAKQAPARTG